jgi:hypothetical protein
MSELRPCSKDPKCWLSAGHKGPHEHIVNGRSVVQPEKKP